jgi:hypothetical protein
MGFAYLSQTGSDFCAGTGIFVQKETGALPEQ